MKRAPFPPPARDDSGKNYWRSLDELEQRAEVQEIIDREFPDGASEAPTGASRRTFLTVMGASLALAGLAGCRRPVEKILPYSRAPEDVVPGRALFFATALPVLGSALGVLVESHDGRPTKIEGNPSHPDSMGATSAYAQAEILELYDPDRSASPRQGAHSRTPAEGDAMLRTLGDRLRPTKGRGFAILTEEVRSPALVAQLEALRAELPEARVVMYDAFSRANLREGGKLVFGAKHDAAIDTSKARVIVSLDADLFGTDGAVVKNARGFAKNRVPERTPKGEFARLYVAESQLTPTGGSADHRVRALARDVARIAFAIGHELSRTHKVQLAEDLVTVMAAHAQALTNDKAQKWVKAAAADLAKNPGRCLVVAGPRQPAAVHAAVWAINAALGNLESTMRPVKALDYAEGPAAVVALADDLRAKKIDTLLVLGGNPAFTAPADAKLAEAIKACASTVHVGTHLDETAAVSQWHINRTHALEAWGDLSSEDGTLAVAQPLIAPMYEGKSDLEVLDLLLGKGRKGHEIVKSTWVGSRVADEKAWRKLLHEGVLASSGATDPAPPLRSPDAAQAVRVLVLGQGTEVSFAPDPHAYDGRFANNGWMQELPDSIYKMTWGNAAVLSPATAQKLGVKDGDLVEVAVGGAKAKLPALVGPGQADDSVALTIGQGRKEVGRVGKGVGFDTTMLRTSAAFGFAADAQVTRTGEVAKLTRTQEHFMLENRPIAREGTLAEWEANPAFPQKREFKHPELLSLWNEVEYKGHRWGMAIDLTTCTGCLSCVVACQAENNIPVVGAEGVQRSREMHWIRIDRYFEGTSDDPSTLVQPMLCQHCENAPCEQVCPVGATTHSPEGLNDMAYNRCIGTKYCANNCPFKVRRFNYFHYTAETPETAKMQRNPNVTVRHRGVIEKCTFCVQRIQEAKIDQKRHGSDRVPDGVIITACQQACPTQAIVFGDVGDPKSAVTKAVGEKRAFKILEELNIKSRISYLARIKNPNTELA